MLADVLHFMKRFDWSHAPEDIRLLLFEMLDESMRTGFSSVLDPTVPMLQSARQAINITHNNRNQQQDASKMEASLRDRIAALLTAEDSSALRHYIETNFLTQAYRFHAFKGLILSI